ncbi:MAG: redoxin family protein [Rhodobacterales bacterium]|nr:redoxin family protein [Rhodobacterales bacterium]NCT11244.1 redoxin family protein [Rhodobacterales bacterium]
MKKILPALAVAAVGIALGLYFAFGAVSSPDAVAGGPAIDTAPLQALREGDMRKLALHEVPQRGSEVAFTGADGSEMTLAAYQGQVVLVNFWATWCAPCRVEMPHLSALQAAMGGADFQVVTIATGRNDPAAITRFLAEIGVDNLPLHSDPQQRLAADMGVLGLPVSLLLDRAGREVGRLQGEADWNSASAQAIIAALVAAN